MTPASPLSNPAFRTLFAAQICSLLAIGLLTVALSLTAYAIGGAATGGRILGMLLALKMVAYVGLAPLAETLLSGQPRKRAMIGLDLARLVVLLPMTVAGETWQIAALAFAFFALSAGFTPLFQSVIPDLLTDEETYGRALAWSRIAYTLEAILSPVIAAALLRLVPAEALFPVAAAAFLGSVAALLATRFPEDSRGPGRGPFLQRAFRGLDIYRRTPRLRGLFLLNLALSLAMAWVLVNSVVYAGQRLGDAEHFYPILMAAYGLGAGLGAVVVPRVRHLGDRKVMAAGAFGFAALALPLWLAPPLPGLLVIWAGFGLTSSLVLTPGGLVIARSAARADRPAVFAAQFSLSHSGWLLAYPLAGWLGSSLPLETALLILAALCAATTAAALRVWPAQDPLERPHSHPDLPEDDPHLREIPATGPQHRHSHAFHIDDRHRHWEYGEA